MSGQRFAINLAVAVFALLEAVAVPIVSFGWLRPQRLIARSSTWIAVPCTVIFRERGPEGGIRHVFVYTVQGRTYRSARSTFWGECADFHHAEGSRVTGLVDPRRPEEAVLRPDYRPPTSRSSPSSCGRSSRRVGSRPTWRSA